MTPNGIADDVVASLADLLDRCGTLTAADVDAEIEATRRRLDTLERVRAVVTVFAGADPGKGAAGPAAKPREPRTAPTGRTSRGREAVARWLARNGSGNAGQIARGAGITRAGVYYVLKHGHWFEAGTNGDWTLTAAGRAGVTGLETANPAA